MGDQLVGRLQDTACAAKVLLQPHDAGLRVIGLEPQDVVDPRTAPTVNRLVGIARHAQVRMIVRQGGDNAVLGRVCVLVLVDENVAVALVEIAAQLGILRQQRDHVQEQVVEVDGVGSQQCLLILGVNPRDDRLHVIADRFLKCPDKHISRLQVVLRPADSRRDAGRRVMDGIDIEFPQRPLDKLALVGGVEDGVVGRESDGLRPSSEQAGAEAMERADPDTAAGQDVRHARVHFGRRFVGEGDRQDLPRIDASLNQVGDAAGNDAGFPRAGSRQHQQGAVDMFDRKLLAGGQAVRCRHRGTTPFAGCCGLIRRNQVSRGDCSA